MRPAPDDDAPTVVTTAKRCPRCDSSDIEADIASREEQIQTATLVCPRCGCRFFYSAYRGLF
jgi:hypothetical protein